MLLETGNVEGGVKIVSFWFRATNVKQRVLILLLCLNNCEHLLRKENLLELSNFQSVLTSRIWLPLACKTEKISAGSIYKYIEEASEQFEISDHQRTPSQAHNRI